MQLFGGKKKGKHSGTAFSSQPPRRRNDDYSEELFLLDSLDDTPTTSAVRQQYVQPTNKKVEEIVAERNKKGKKKKAGKVILIILLVLAILAAGAYVAVEYFLDPPDQNGDGLDGTKPTGTQVEGRKDGVYTFLVAGTDQISNNTDTIMIGSFDTKNGKLNVVSIPRDTLTNIQHEVKKANAAYHYASYYKDIEGSSYYGVDPIQSMRQELVKSMLGFDVDSYVLVNLEACEQVVDAIGGVEFDVPLDMNYDSNKQDLHIHINKGVQTLSGEQFVQIMRFRSAYSGGDLDRIEMQHKLLKALADQMLTLGNVPNAAKVAQIVSDNMQTDLSVENIAYFIKEFIKLDKEDVQFMTMPKIEAGNVFGYSYVFTDIDAWLDMVNEYINPWDTDVTVNNVDIITVKDGNFYSTTGELNGGISSFLSYNTNDSLAYAQVLQWVPSTNTQDKDVTENDGTA